jgi:tRNA dimethylallyltransferase
MPGPTERLPRLLLAGPTASGKSETALILAQRLNGEIITVDSMQVYRGMDIGTAKPTAAERQAVRHHLLDVAEVGEPFDAARFLQLATAAEREIQARGALPIYCGGTGLYFKALLEGLGSTPPSDPALRATLEALPLDVLLDELAAKDPATWERLDRQNPRRVVRAVEILRLTGQPLAPQRAPWSSPPTSDSPSHSHPLSDTGSVRGSEVSVSDGPGPAGSEPVWVLRRGPDVLRARIDARVEAMFAAGLVAETAALFARQGGAAVKDGEPSAARTALQAIGYRQVLEHLEGARSLADTVELVKIKTRQFAKRQMTWFRGQLPARWVDVAPDESGAAVANRVERAFLEFRRGT